MGKQIEIKAAKSFARTFYKDPVLWNVVDRFLDAIPEAACSAPATSAGSSARGYWVRQNGSRFVTCSNCNDFGSSHASLYNFCPSCGARMAVGCIDGV